MGSDASGGFGNAEAAEAAESSFGDAPADNADKPFDDTPFDAGVEADEESSPEKYIQQLSGKLGQSLRKHTQEIGTPDFDLEKFAINSVLSATNSSKMDQQDQADIIQKVKSSSTDGSDDKKDNTAEPDGEVVNDNGDNNDAESDGTQGEINLDNIDMEESHNPNINRKTVFQNPTLGVKDGGMEENKYLNLESSKKSSIFVDNNKKIIQKMVKEQLRLSESPTITPTKTPTIAPTKEPSRRSKPWTIIPEGLPNPQPKATEENKINFISNDNFSGADGIEEVEVTFDVNNVRFVEKFKNTGEVLEKPMAYDEPWIYKFETEPTSNGNVYTVAVSFYGNPHTNLTLDGFADGNNPHIEEV